MGFAENYLAALYDTLFLSIILLLTSVYVVWLTIMTTIYKFYWSTNINIILQQLYKMNVKNKCTVRKTGVAGLVFYDTF